MRYPLFLAWTGMNCSADLMSCTRTAPYRASSRDTAFGRIHRAGLLCSARARVRLLVRGKRGSNFSDGDSSVVESLELDRKHAHFRPSAYDNDYRRNSWSVSVADASDYSAYQLVETVEPRGPETIAEVHRSGHAPNVLVHEPFRQ